MTDQQRIAKLEEILAKCATQFRFYAKQHRDKGTFKSAAKARVNEAFAAMCGGGRAMSDERLMEIRRLRRIERRAELEAERDQARWENDRLRISTANSGEQVDLDAPEPEGFCDGQ